MKCIDLNHYLLFSGSDELILIETWDKLWAAEYDAKRHGAGDPGRAG